MVSTKIPARAPHFLVLDELSPSTQGLFFHQHLLCLRWRNTASNVRTATANSKWKKASANIARPLIIIFIALFAANRCCITVYILASWFGLAYSLSPATLKSAKTPLQSARIKGRRSRYYSHIQKDPASNWWRDAEAIRLWRA